MFVGCDEAEDTEFEISLDRITEVPTHFEDEQLFVVLADGEARAYWDIGPLNCPLIIMDEPHPRFPEAIFREDGCAGARYNRSGEKVFGPGPERLDEFATEVRGSELIVHLDEASCVPPGRTTCPAESRFADADG